MYLSTFVNISSFQSPREVWEYWLPLLQNIKWDSKLSVEPLLLPGLTLYLHTRAFKSEYLKISPANNSVSITRRFVYNVQGTASDQKERIPGSSWLEEERRWGCSTSRSLLIFHLSAIIQSVILLSSLRPRFWPISDEQLSELKGLIWLKNDHLHLWQEPVCIIGLLMGNRNEYWWGEQSSDLHEVWFLF